MNGCDWFSALVAEVLNQAAPPDGIVCLCAVLEIFPERSCSADDSAGGGFGERLYFLEEFCSVNFPSEIFVILKGFSDVFEQLFALLFGLPFLFLACVADQERFISAEDNLHHLSLAGLPSG